MQVQGRCDVAFAGSPAGARRRRGVLCPMLVAAGCDVRFREGAGLVRRRLRGVVCQCSSPSRGPLLVLVPVMGLCAGASRCWVVRVGRGVVAAGCRVSLLVACCVSPLCF